MTVRYLFRRCICSVSQISFKPKGVIAITGYQSHHKDYQNSSNKNKRIQYLAPLLASGAALVSLNNGHDKSEELYDMLMKSSPDVLKIRQLLSDGADPNFRHKYGWCLLHIAIAKGNTQVAKLLLRFGADSNICDDYSGLQSTAHKLGLANMPSEITKLARARKSLNTNYKVDCDYRGFTPLHYAVLNDDSKLVKVLLDNNAIVNLKSLKYNLSPIELTADNDIRKMIIREESLQKKKHILNLKGFLENSIIGQRDAIEQVTAAVQRKDLGWQEEKPLVMLFVGSSGIGKTETAKQLAVYRNSDCSDSFVRIDMSEFQEKHEVSKFIGAPPGYIGYDEGGQLTKALTKNPEAIVLFDEVEKAHPDVLNIMLQLYDEGRLTDGKGKTVLCPKAIFIMTTNVGADQIAQNLGPIDEDFKSRTMYPLLKSAFKRNEFLGRINEIVYFLPFTITESSCLVTNELIRIKDIASKQDITFSWDEESVVLLSKALDSNYGARSLKNEVSRRVLNEVANLYLHSKIIPGSNVKLTVENKELKFVVS